MSPSGMNPDLSIVKVEKSDGAHGSGLNMHVDMQEEGVMHIHRGRMAPGGEHDGVEPTEQELEDWAREEMSNEGSNISGDQNNSWYMGTFKGRFCVIYFHIETCIKGTEKLIRDYNCRSQAIVLLD